MTVSPPENLSKDVIQLCGAGDVEADDVLLTPAADPRP